MDLENKPYKLKNDAIFLDITKNTNFKKILGSELISRGSTYLNNQYRLGYATMINMRVFQSRVLRILYDIQR